MKKVLAIPTILVLALVLSACATVFKGGTSDVAFDSNPQGAEIIIDGVSYGVTPLSIELESNRNYTVVLRNNGEEREIILRSEIGTLWLVLDIVTGVIPVIVDAATGNWYELQPGEVYVTFDGG